MTRSGDRFDERTAHPADDPRRTISHVTAMLERMVGSGGGVPIAIFHDGRSKNVNERVHAFAERERVVLMRNRPRTPQHNPWAENKHAAVRVRTGLRPDTKLPSVEDAKACVDAGLDALDRRWARVRHGGLTPADRCQLGGASYSRAWREETWGAAEAARERARAGPGRAGDRIMAEREAVLEVLEQRGVLYRVRGGVRNGRAE